METLIIELFQGFFFINSLHVECRLDSFINEKKNYACKFFMLLITFETFIFKILI